MKFFTLRGADGQMVTYTNRKEVPAHEKWNLADIYSDIKKWEEDYLLIEEDGGKPKAI